MSFFSFVACMIDQHDPVRRNVVWNGRAYTGVCRHCGTAIERHGRRRWHKHKPDMATDGD